MHYTTSCNTQSSAPEDGRNNRPKHVELIGIINKPLLLHLVCCLYYLYQCCTVKQISDKEIYLLIKYIKSVLWRVAKLLSYIEDAWCLKVNPLHNIQITNKMNYNVYGMFYSQFFDQHVSAPVAAMVLVQAYICTNVFSCVAVAP